MTDPSRKNIFTGMNLVDWALAFVFTAALALIGSLLLPGYGWGPGVLLAVFMLYLAKRRRDHYHDAPPSEE